jgi:hypothetical protein
MHVVYYSSSTSRLFHLLCLLFYLVQGQTLLAQTKRRYVKPVISGTGDGTSWANASNDIAAMIAASSTNDQIWVATGTYSPAATLSMKNGVTIYGGFQGIEPIVGHRNVKLYPTTISGGGVRRVFYNLDINETAILDGFIVSNGFVANDGAGMYNDNSHPVIRNCIFSDNILTNNSGAGGAIYNNNSNPFISNCTFSGNRVNSTGGGIHNKNSNPTISSCIFTNNSAHAGGGMTNSSSNAVVSNCVFTSNTSTTSAGGVYNTGASRAIFTNCVFFGNSTLYGGGLLTDSSEPVEIANCVFSNNSSSDGGGIAIVDSNPTIVNSIIYGNTATSGSPNIYIQDASPSVTFSNIEGGYSGTGNIDSDPLFVHADTPAGLDGIWLTADDGLRVFIDSPCLNAGTIGGNIPINDMLGIQRSVSNPTMGPYEKAISRFQIIYVNGSISTSGDGGAWAKAKKTVQEALQLTTDYNFIHSIWIAKGTYTPNAILSMKNNLAIYGGFDGTETELSERDFIKNRTIISGGNARPVFNNKDLNSTAVLDGCTISNGYSGWDYEAGAMMNSGAHITIKNCVFSNNKSEAIGGAMTNLASDVNISNCVFTGNVAKYNSGGAIINNASSAHISNTVFTGNMAGGVGGAIHTLSSASSRYADPVINNCVFVGNNASGGGGAVYFYRYSRPIITNTIMYLNTMGRTPVPDNIQVDQTTLTISHSIIEGGYPGTGNMDVDPLFVNVDSPAGADGVWMTYDDGLALFRCSPAIDMGTTLTPELALDLLGNSRVGAYDIGAYEFHSGKQVLASAAGGEPAAVTIVQSGQTFFSPCNDGLIVAVTSRGPDPIAGATTTKVWVESTQPAQYVRRHYEISPEDNAANATGRVTLYFTQEEFDDFNNDPLNTSKLPTKGDDATGISHLVIEKRPGVSSDNSGLPTSYTGTPETIDPADEDIVWIPSLNRWEVTFDVDGFSGFFVKSTLNPLPVTLIRFAVAREAQSNLLSWATASEVNTDQFEVQRSSNAKTFWKIGTVDAGGSGSNTYSFSDKSPYAGTNYYRLKMLDLDGTYSYSKMISLSSDGPGASVYPNPSKGLITIQGSITGDEIVLMDMWGRTLQKIDVTQDNFTVDLSKYPSGIYLLRTVNGVQKIVRD